MDKLRRGAERFDVLVFAGVLTEVTDPIGVLEAGALLAEPGGRVIATAPNASCAGLVEALIGGRWPPAPLRWLTRASLQEVLEESGFIEVAVDPVPSETGSTSFFAVLREAGIAYCREEMEPLHWIATGKAPAP
jgi:hypothetical protein